jgi:hypothetical protein
MEDGGSTFKISTGKEGYRNETFRKAYAYLGGQYYN